LFTLQIGLIQAQLNPLTENVLGGKAWCTFVHVRRVWLSHGIRSLPHLHHTTHLCASSTSYISISFHATFIISFGQPWFL